MYFNNRHFIYLRENGFFFFPIEKSTREKTLPVLILLYSKSTFRIIIINAPYKNFREEKISQRTKRVNRIQYYIEGKP